MPTPLKTIFLSEIILVFAMIAGVVPQEFSYLILVLLGVSFMKLSLLDSLKLFILSIPFFVALPANALSDSMSIWRILILVLFLRAGWEKYCHFVRQLADSGSINNKGLACFQFARRCMKKIGKDGGYMQKILKRVQNDNHYKLFFLTILFFIIAAISLISAQDIGAGIKKILFLLNIFLLFPVVIFTIKKENNLIEILKAIFYSSVIIVFIGYFQFILTFFITLSQFWFFWTDNVIKAFYGQNLSYLLSYSNTWFSYYKTLPPALRMFSVLPDSHSFAMIIIISIPVILSFLFLSPITCLPDRQAPPKMGIIRKKYISAVLMFFLLAIFFSGSRGAWVGSIFALLAGLFLFLSSSIKTKNNSKLEKVRLAILEFIKLLKSKVGFNFNIEHNSKYYSKLIIFSILLFFVLMPVSSLILKQNQEVQIARSNISLSDDGESKFLMIERAFSITDFSETSNKGRLQIWRETLISIKERPLLGVGFGNFPLILGEKMSALKKGSSAHSLYFDIAAEIGIFGLVIFLFLIVEILKMSYKLYFKTEKKYLKIFAGSFFVYFIWICAYSIFDVVIFNDKVLMTTVIIIGTLYSIKKIE